MLAQVKKDQLEAKGESLSEADEAKLKAPILEKYETEGHPLYATARLWDDGVVDPRQTRSALALAFSASLNAEIPDYRAPVPELLAAGPVSEQELQSWVVCWGGSSSNGRRAPGPNCCLSGLSPPWAAAPSTRCVAGSRRTPAASRCRRCA